MGSVFTIAVICGLFDLYFDSKKHFPSDGDNLDLEFHAYLKMFGKSYKHNDTYQAHKAEFIMNRQLIEKQAFFADFYIGLNQMSDWT
jgi:hypothetical protein